MSKEINFLIDGITFLLNHGLNRGKLTSAICKGVADLAAHSPVIESHATRFSIDRCSEDGQEWWIQASTDSSTSIGVRYPAGHGLTGWVLQRKRQLLYESEKRRLPQDVTLLPGYENTESAFIQLLRIDGRAAGCLCVVSDERNAIQPASADVFFKLGKSIETLVSKSRDWKPSSRFQGDLPPARINEAAILEWIRKRFPSHFRWAYFWKWQEPEQHLFPIPLTSALLDLNKNWLRPLRIGEGFVGTCAARLDTIVEQELEEGRGKITEIVTPLRKLKPAVSVRSVLVTPVRDREKFYGVLAILGESANLFHEGDAVEIEALARELSHQFRQADDMVIADIQRKVRDRLLDCLRLPLPPTEYWQELSEAMDLLCKGGICSSASLLVAKRHKRHLFTLKSCAPLEDSDERIVVNADEDNLLGSILKRGEAPRSIDRAPKDGILRKLITARSESLWINAYAFDKASKHPTFVSIAGFPSRSHLSAPFGVRPLEYAVVETFGEIFSVTRAILTAADLADLSRRQAWLMTAETHDVLQPLSTIKHAAESLSANSEDDVERVQRILSAAEGLLVRRENFLFKSLGSGHGELTSEEIAEPIDIWKLISSLIRDLDLQHPDQQIVLRGEPRPNFYRVAGYKRWLRVAFRNILDNAIKFGRNSQVTVSMRISAESSHNPGREDKFVLVSIQDHGIGIPEAELQSIFRAGHRNEYSRRHEATGSQVALSVTKEIIGTHKGSIWATSTINKGSAFHIKLPWISQEEG